MLAECPGGLVEQQHVQVRGQRPRQVDDLLLAEGKRGNRQIDLQRRAQKRQRLTGDAPALSRREPLVRPAEGDVVRDRKILRERGLLVDHLDARALHVARVAAQGHGPPLHLHRAALGTERAGGNVHERRLAGPVVPQQPDDLARTNVEGDIGKRHVAAEGDMDAIHAEQRRPRFRVNRGGSGSAGRLLHGTAATASARRSEARSVPHVADVEVLRRLGIDQLRQDENVL